MHGLNSSSSESSIDSGIESPGHSSAEFGNAGSGIGVASSRGSPVGFNEAITSSSLSTMMVRMTGGQAT